LRGLIASAMRDDFEIFYQRLSTAAGLSDAAMQQRKLKNVCLAYLSVLNDENAIAWVYHQFTTANNMTDQYAALAALAHCDCSEREQALAAFEKQWKHETNVMDKWFAVQAASSLPGTLERVQSLLNHVLFDLTNPNKVRALIGTFAMRNPAAFHAEDGSGYQFIADQVLALDRINPQIASRMVRALMNWKRLEPVRSALNRTQLQRIADTEGVSADVYEIASKSLV